MTELYMWQSIKNACKDQSVVCRNDETVLSNMSGMEVEHEELMKEDQDLVNIDDTLSHRSCILMEGDKYEMMPVEVPEPAPLENEYGFDTTMRGIIDVTDDHLDTSDLRMKPTDELNFDKTGDLIHETEDISLQSDSGTEGSSIILNVWNEDYEGNPDPEMFDRLLRAKHLPKNIDPQVLLRIKRARIINRIREIEDDESSQGSCGVMWNRMCMPGGFEHDDGTDEGGSVHTSNTEADADESIKQESIAGTVDSEVFQFKHPKRSQYALVPDNAYRPGASPTSLVMMLPSPNGNNFELTPMNSFTRDDDSRSRKTCTEKEIEFTLQKYDQTPFRIAQLVLSGEKSKSADEDYEDDASALTEPCLEEQEDANSTVMEQKTDPVIQYEEEEKVISLDEFVMKLPRFVEDEDPVDCDRSLSSYSRMKVATPFSDLYKVFTSSDFELQTDVERIETSNKHEEEFSALTLPAYVKDCAIAENTFADSNESSLEHEDDVLGKSSYETDLVEIFGENTEDLHFSEDNPLQASDIQNDECSELSIIEEHVPEEHILSSDVSYASETESSAVEESQNMTSDNQMSFEESAEHSIDELANKNAIYERQSSDLFGSIALATQVGNPTMAQDESGEADISEEHSDESLGSDLKIAPTMSSQSEGDGVSLNPVSSSYSFVNMAHQENYVHSPIAEQTLSKGKNFEESTDELDQPNNPVFVPRSSLVQSDKGIPAIGTEESDEMTDTDDRQIDLARTASSNLDLSDLEEALDIQIQVTSTGSYMSYTTADGEEVVIAIPVEGNVTVPQPNSRYGRIITPEEYERLQSSLVATYTVDSIAEGLDEDLSSVDGEVGESNLDCSDICESFGDENEMNLANSCENDAKPCKHEDMLEKERNTNISCEGSEEDSSEARRPIDDNVNVLVELVEETLEIIDEPTIANIRDDSIIPDTSNYELQRDRILQEMVQNNEEDTLEIIEDCVDAVDINEESATEIPTIDTVPQSAPQDVEEFSTPQSKIEDLPSDDTLVIEEAKETSQIKEASIENVANVESDSFATAEEEEQHLEPYVETKGGKKALIDSSEQETMVRKRTMKKGKMVTPSRKGGVKSSSSLQSPTSTTRKKVTKKPTLSGKSGPKLKKKPTTDTVVDDLLALKRSMEKNNRSRKGKPSISTKSLLDAAMKVEIKTDATNGRKIRKSVKS